MVSLNDYEYWHQRKDYYDGQHRLFLPFTIFLLESYSLFFLVTERQVTKTMYGLGQIGISHLQAVVMLLHPISRFPALHGL